MDCMSCAMSECVHLIAPCVWCVSLLLCVVMLLDMDMSFASVDECIRAVRTRHEGLVRKMTHDVERVRTYLQLDDTHLLPRIPQTTAEATGSAAAQVLLRTHDILQLLACSTIRDASITAVPTTRWGRGGAYDGNAGLIMRHLEYLQHQHLQQHSVAASSQRAIPPAFDSVSPLVAAVLSLSTACVVSCASLYTLLSSPSCVLLRAVSYDEEPMYAVHEHMNSADERQLYDKGMRDLDILQQVEATHHNTGTDICMYRRGSDGSNNSKLLLVLSDPPSLVVAPVCID